MLATCANAYRLQFGVDITDESVYVGLAYRFVLGDRPFVDEFSLHQTSALITYPLVKAYFSVVGSLDGVMLFMRSAHLAFTVLLSALVYLALRTQLPSPLAIITAATCVAFVPFNVHNLSYYTLSSGFFTAGLLLGWLSSLGSRRNVLLFLAGACQGLAMVAFPTFIVPTTCVALLLLSIRQERGGAAVATVFIAGVATSVTPFLAVVILAGPEAVLTSLETFLMYYGSGNSTAPGLAERVLYLPVVGKTIRVLLRYIQWFPSEGIGAKALFLLVLVGLKRNAAWGRYGLLASPLLMLTEPSFVAGLNFVRNYALLAPFLAYFLWSDRTVRFLFCLVWVPAFVAGLAVAWSSGNGAYAAAVGFFPGSLVTTVCLVRLMATWLPQSTKLGGLQVLAVLWPVLALLASIGSMLHDDPIRELSAQIRQGPYRGLFTTRVNHSHLEQLGRDIAKVYEPKRRILCLYAHAGGYLFSTMRPATNGIFLHSPVANPGFDSRSTLAYYASAGVSPDVVIVAKKIPLGQTHRLGPVEIQYSRDDPLYQMVTGPKYKVVFEREFYDVLVRH